MPTFKSVIAGLALATGMTGGVVGLGALTTASAAGATTAGAATSVAGFSTGGCGWRRCWGGWGGRRGHHGRQRVKVHIHIHNNNTNDNDNDADADAVAVNVPNRDWRGNSGPFALGE
ncbi:hypothetical protein [Nonomuraea lactucae]|uniref:hypothetical protein n=1 Tax=Nonomuraea lactucae TaxID=2249762 RepID=UPI0013B423C2|nr:hypothetical protein [Nonomuraea lactucae]